jgi:hypothetical protein
VTSTSRAESLSFGALVALIVVYLVLLQLGGLLLREVLGVDATYAELPDAESMLASIVIPVAVSLVRARGADRAGRHGAVDHGLREPQRC